MTIDLKKTQKVHVVPLVQEKVSNMFKTCDDLKRVLTTSNMALSHKILDLDITFHIMFSCPKSVKI